MNATPGATIEIEGESRREPFQPDDYIVREIDTRLKENPFRLTSADHRDLTRPSFGESIVYALFGGFLLLTGEILVRMWLNAAVESWQPYAAAVFLFSCLVAKLLGPELLDQKRRRILREMEKHFEKQRSYVQTQKERLNQYDD